MILAYDNTGQKYFSLLQSNSNTKTMELFFRGLVQRLDKDRIKWREDSLIVLDNAPYHTSSATISLFKKLNLPICFTGPHSFDASPCELMFCHFKQGDINPRHLPMGKSYVITFTNILFYIINRRFDNVLKLVFKQW